MELETGALCYEEQLDIDHKEEEEELYYVCCDGVCYEESIAPCDLDENKHS